MAITSTAPSIRSSTQSGTTFFHAPFSYSDRNISSGGRSLGGNLTGMRTIVSQYDWGYYDGDTISAQCSRPEAWHRAEFWGQLSPDGNWLAYQSYESGRYEVYIRAFPGESSGAGGKWQVSNQGGSAPRELFTFPTATGAYATFTYDVTADGQRFLVLEAAAVFCRAARVHSFRAARCISGNVSRELRKTTAGSFQSATASRRQQSSP